MEENNLSSTQPKKSGLPLLVFFVVMAGAVIYLITTSSSSNTPQPTTQNQNKESPQASESDTTTAEDNLSNKNENPEETADSNVKVVNVTGSNFAFNPKTITVNKGETVRIVFTSENGFHDFVLDQFGIRTEVLNSGGTDTVEFVADQTGTFEYYCSVGSHRAMGMVGNLIVQ